MSWPLTADVRRCTCTNTPTSLPSALALRTSSNTSPSVGTLQQPGNVEHNHARRAHIPSQPLLLVPQARYVRLASIPMTCMHLYLRSTDWSRSGNDCVAHSVLICFRVRSDAK